MKKMFPRGGPDRQFVAPCGARAFGVRAPGRPRQVTEIMAKQAAQPVL